jgi:hypothetical protein
MKDLIYNLTWWLLFAVLVCFAAFDVDDLVFYWLSSFLIGSAIVRIFERHVK